MRPGSNSITGRKGVSCFVKNPLSFTKRGGPSPARLQTCTNKPTPTLFQELVTERLARHTGERLDDLELTAGEGFADVNVVDQVVISLHGDFALRGFE